MLVGLTWLLVCQLVGELVVRLSGLPVPGPVVGMVLLFVALQAHAPGPEHAIFRASDRLLRHLQLLFIPAGVGVITALSRFADDALPITVGLVGSWLLGLVVVGGLVEVLLRWRGRRQGRPEGEPA
ncbi:CidA/LrgA family protein [Nocardioides pacificus]